MPNRREMLKILQVGASESRPLNCLVLRQDAPPVPTVCFVADLHKFAARSDAESVDPELRRVAGRCDRCVLGGDIFDFRWSTLGSREATADAAVEWLAGLLGACPSTTFHLLLGNHDHASPLLARLPALADASPRFAWHQYFLRVGETVFLHGDAADVPRRRRSRVTPADRLAMRRERSLHHGSKTKGRAANGVYRQFVRSRLHHLVPRVAYPKRRVAARLTAYLEHLDMAAVDGVRSVYFGHTHLPIDGYRYAGMRFYNGGAPIGSRSFRILTTEVSADAAVHAH